MRDLRLLDAIRDTGPEVIAIWGWAGDETCGRFYFNSPIDQAPMTVVAAAGEGWDHVSVSRRNRCPNWPEMEAVKHAFFRDDETAMQLHVPSSDHINCHPYCLHLWRPHDVEIPRPPSIMVGPSADPRPVFTEGGVEKMIADLNRVAADSLFSDPATSRAIERLG